MTRNTILTILAVVAVVVGVPVGIVALAGGDDDEAPRSGAAPGQTYPEGIDAGNAPEEQLDPEGRDERPGNGNAKPRGRGGPPREYPQSANVAYPNDVTQSGGDVARVIERHLGAIAPKADQLTVLGADCRRGACSARYVSGPHGGGRISNDAAVIVRRLFALGSIRTVKLFVHEPRGKRSKQPEPMALMVIACRRAAHPAYDWTRLTSRQLPRRCSVVEQSPGKLGSQIRKGTLSEEEASRGRSGSNGGRAGASSGAAPGLDPAGTPAPENVNPRRPKRGERDPERDGG